MALNCTSSVCWWEEDKTYIKRDTFRK